MTATKKTTEKKKPAAKKAPVSAPANAEKKDEPIKKSPSVKKTAKASKGSSKVKPGNYIYALGRRKEASAQTRLYPSGKGELVVNGKKYDEYFVTIDQKEALLKPLELTGHAGAVDVDFRIIGGGMTGQSEAARLGLSRALIKMDPELRKILKKIGFLRRDARKKERKKPGLKKARRAPQWSKR